MQPDFKPKQKNVKLGGSLNSERANRTRALFLKYYENKIAVISLEQLGDYGKTVHVTARANLSGMNKKTLKFYSYDPDTGKFIPLDPQPIYYTDNGYLHFDTYLAGDIIITDSPLQRKVST